MKSKTGGLRFNEDKLQWGLVDFDALESMVRVLEHGKEKYDAWNWKKGLPYVSVIESMLRHIYAFLKGEDIDPESGLPHTGHIMCNAMFLDYYWKYKSDMDDRFIDIAKKESVCKQEGCGREVPAKDEYCGYHINWDSACEEKDTGELIVEDEKKEESKTEQESS